MDNDIDSIDFWLSLDDRRKFCKCLRPDVRTITQVDDDIFMCDVCGRHVADGKLWIAIQKLDQQIDRKRHEIVEFEYQKIAIRKQIKKRD